MQKHSTNRLGYLPIAIGLSLIIFAALLLFLQVCLNDVLSGSSQAYAKRFDFWLFWAPIITISLIVGSLFAVLGIAILKRIKSKLSYLLITAGFVLISINAYQLFFTFIIPGINSIGLSNLDSVTFFSLLMAGLFLELLGVIFGLSVGNRLSSASLTGGFVLILMGIFFLIFDVAITLSIDPQGGFGAFRWFYFWQNFHPLIPFSLIIGIVLILIAAYKRKH